jgi:cytochrome c oxidase accessory protein FixG
MSETSSAGVANGRDEAVSQFLYEKRQKIYPREVHGWFARLRVISVLVLLGLFYGVAWLQWDGRQAVLWDLPARKFYVWGWVFWPQDFIYLTFLLIIAALSLFFFTTLAGRLWCGYACPQTVWTETFLWIERMVEGDRPAQMKLDRSPWSWRKARIKATKHFLWIVFSLFTGLTFTGYFTPIRELTHDFFALEAGGWATFWVLFYGFATYGNAGWMREQVCKYMCPYARFQSAMFDKDTLIVSYDPGRGEPRGSRRRSIDHRAAGLGDCIDCGFCVQVCPTGIDIRNGLQYECISCSACIDACNSVMDKMGYAPGLIRYTTQHALEGKPTKLLRARVFVYGGLLLLMVIALGIGIATRSPLALDVMRDRNQLYRETEDGRIENVYTLRIINKSGAEHELALAAAGIDGLEIGMDKARLVVGPGEVLDVPVRLRAEEHALRARSTEVVFELRALDDPSLTVEADGRFLGPSR